MTRFLPHKQDKLSNKKAGVNGNCYQTIVACFLKVPVNQVPNVETLFDIKEQPTLWLDVMQSWLQSQGYITRSADEFKCFHLTTDEQKAMWQDKYGVPYTQTQFELSNMLYFVVGVSNRGVNHIVMYMNGKMVHDPHPSGDGLVPVENEARDWSFEIIEQLRD